MAVKLPAAAAGGGRGGGGGGGRGGGNEPPTVVAKIGQAKNGMTGGMWPNSITMKAYTDAKAEAPKALSDANALFAKAAAVSTSLAKFNLKLDAPNRGGRDGRALRRRKQLPDFRGDRGSVSEGFWSRPIRSSDPDPRSPILTPVCHRFAPWGGMKTLHFAAAAWLLATAPAGACNSSRTPLSRGTPISSLAGKTFTKSSPRKQPYSDDWLNSISRRRCCRLGTGPPPSEDPGGLRRRTKAASTASYITTGSQSTSMCRRASIAQQQSVAVGQKCYQFFRNQWFHPHVGALRRHRAGDDARASTRPTLVPRCHSVTHVSTTIGRCQGAPRTPSTARSRARLARWGSRPT